VGQNVRKGVLFVRFYAPLIFRLKTAKKSQGEKLKKSEKLLPRRHKGRGHEIPNTPPWRIREIRLQIANRRVMDYRNPPFQTISNLKPKYQVVTAKLYRILFPYRNLACVIGSLVGALGKVRVLSELPVTFLGNVGKSLSRLP